MTDFFAPLETQLIARAGMVYGIDHKRITGKINAAFKAGVFCSNVGLAFPLVKQLVAATDDPLGVVEYEAGVAPVGDGINEFSSGDRVMVVREGCIWVISEEAMAIGDDVYVRHTASGGNTLKGAIRNDADTATAVQVLGVRVVLPTITQETILLTCLELNLP